MHKVEQESTKKNNAEFLKINAQMKYSHSQLATANSIVIESNKIVSGKLRDTEAKMKELDETLVVQSSTIKNSTFILITTEECLGELHETNSPA